MAPSRRSSNNNNKENPGIVAIIAQQLQYLFFHSLFNQCGLTSWVNVLIGWNGENVDMIEKMENVIDNSRCTKNKKVKHVASSFVNKALTWWNTQVQARGREAVIGMSCTDFKALFIEEFCPSNEMEKLEFEFWNHKMVGANHVGYTNQFHELAKLVPHLVTLETSRDSGNALSDPTNHNPECNS
ncbi:reverse transcriptase domain-containing protein [Tanacetum coccineum]